MAATKAKTKAKKASVKSKASAEPKTKKVKKSAQEVLAKGEAETITTTPATTDVLAKKTKAPNPNAKWYVLNVQSGYENAVKEAIKQRIDAIGVEDLITEILVPTQKKIVIKKGKQEIKEEKIFPGYVLIKMVHDENTVTLIMNTEGIRGFVKMDKYPRPLAEKEVQAIMKFMEVEQPAYQASFSVGEAVKIIDGAFADFIGTVTNIDQTKGRVTVTISFLGREAPYELEFSQVSKL